MSRNDGALAPQGDADAVLEEIRERLTRAYALQVVVDDLVRSASHADRGDGEVVVTTTSRAWDAINTLARP